MSDWKQAYYDRKEKEHLEMVQCWCFVVLVCIGVAAAFAVFVGVAAAVRWLIGGA
jgi:hypothetical protein